MSEVGDLPPVIIAIVGAGPAAFYAAEALLKQTARAVQIDFFNRFPTPFGLVREGVAPDHQSIKAVTRVYEKILDNPAVRYFGNVTFGIDIHHADLTSHYDQIIYAVGAQTDRQMGIPGEDLRGSLAATMFVGWYNAHPEYAALGIDLTGERVVVVGNGNVAMDVTRILVTETDELSTTDMADHAIAALRASSVREVVMLGRRGPAQAAFTNAELKEFGELHGVDVVVDRADVELDAVSAASLAENKIASKNVELLKTYAARSLGGQPRRIVMRFLTSPVELLGEDGHVAGVRIERNTLVDDGRGGLKAQGTGVYETIPCNMVLRSVGYRGVKLDSVPFDERAGIIPNQVGRVTDGPGGPVVPGEYVVGWIKRGPSGVIGTNKPDSLATVQAMLADMPAIAPAAPRDPLAIVELLAQRKPDVVTRGGWSALDAHETGRGKEQGRPRVKLTSVADMLAIITGGEPR